MKQKLKIRTKWLLNLHDTKIGTMSLEIKNFLKGSGIFVTENLTQKNERTTWFCKCLGTGWEHNV